MRTTDGAGETRSKSMSVVHLDRTKDKTVDAIVRAAYPSYNGRRVEAVIRDEIRITGTLWDEGSRRVYCVVRLADMERAGIEPERWMERSEFHEKPHKIEPGYVVVVHCQGRYEYVEIVGPAANITPMLPRPVELTDDERTVLIATRSIKAVYGGVSNYRFHEAKRARGITLERWEAAKASLIARKLLNKAGALTIEGRNSMGGFEQL
jgi:hypothetical protein